MKKRLLRQSEGGVWFIAVKTMAEALKDQPKWQM